MNIPKKYLTEQVILIEARIDNMSILRILTQNKQINKADPNYNYYVQLANWANSKQEKTGEIDLTTIKLSDNSLVQKGKLAKNTKHLGATLEQLKNLMDQEGKYNSESELSNLIQKTTLEILAGLSGIKNPKPEAEPEAEPEEELDTEPKSDPKVKSGGGRDWTAYRAKKLASANGNTAKALNEFYDEYYSQEFAGVESPAKDTKGIVAKLKSLDKILIPEFNKLGYNPEVNPFASFLKSLIKKESDIFDKLTYNTYGATHNSFIDKKITGNMLGQKFDETNILFCSDLYNKNGLDIVNYLDLQDQALAAGEKRIVMEDENEGVELYPAEVNTIECAFADGKFVFTGTNAQFADMYRPDQSRYALSGGALCYASSASVKLAAQRWYLDIVSYGGRPQSAISVNAVDGTTGINEVKTENGEVKAIFDLTGRRVAEMTAPGIYIVGGKKVLVK
jgi:hypothetical protein